MLASRGGDTADWNEEFPLANIIDSNGLEHAVWALRCVDLIYARRFAYRCANEVRHLMPAASVVAMDVMERYLRGEASIKELRESRSAAAYADAADAAAADAVYTGAIYTDAIYAVAAIAAAIAAAAVAVYAADATVSDARKKQAGILREVLT